MNADRFEAAHAAMPDRERLMLQVQMTDFAMVDLELYLDTHPMDQTALEYYRQFQKLHDHAVDDFTAKYGPLTANYAAVSDHWTWVMGPWPWEREA